MGMRTFILLTFVIASLVYLIEKVLKYLVFGPTVIISSAATQDIISDEFTVFANKDSIQKQWDFYTFICLVLLLKENKMSDYQRVSCMKYMGLLLIKWDNHKKLLKYLKEFMDDKYYFSIEYALEKVTERKNVLMMSRSSNTYEIENYERLERTLKHDNYILHYAYTLDRVAS